MRIGLFTAVSALLLVGAGARADKPTWSGSVTETTTATVKSVDQQTRMVTLTGADGSDLTFKAGDRVKNLKQVKPGDQVTIAVRESLTLRLLGKDENPPELAEAAVASSAPAGAKPSGYIAQDTSGVAVVTVVDKAKNVVTLKGPRGNSYPIKPKDPTVFDKVKVGDRVAFSFVESLAVAVTPKG